MTAKNTTSTATFTTSSKISMSLVLSLFVLLFLLTGCREPATAPEKVEAAGTYTLATVDGKDVPASVSHGGTALQVRSGTFAINADGTCRSTTIFVPPSGEEVSRKVDATYTLDGSTLHMQWEGAGTTIGTVEGNTFTMNNEGMIFVYRRPVED
jgi:hypothetical protein